MLVADSCFALKVLVRTDSGSSSGFEATLR